MLELIILILLLVLGVAIYLAYHYNKINQNLNKQLLEQNGSFTSTTTSQQKDLEVYLREMEKLQEEVTFFKNSYEYELNRNNEVLSAKKSTEVRTAAILETFSPLIEQLEGHNLKEIRWLGSPIDFVVFEFNEEPAITFLEIKSGNAQETKRQKIIKNAIKLGKVYYKQIRINEKGITKKQEENKE